MKKIIGIFILFLLINSIAKAQKLALSNNGTQIAVANISVNSTKAIIYTFKAGATIVNAQLTGLTFTTGGTAVAADIVQYQLWYNNKNDFKSASPIGSVAGFNAGLGTFGGFVATTIKNGESGYFWITADIAINATQGNKLSVNALAKSDFTIAGGAATFTGTPTAGGLQTILQPTIALSDNGTQIGGGKVIKDSRKNIIYSFTALPAVVDANLTGLTFTTTTGLGGNLTPRDITKYKLWYTDKSNDISKASIIGYVAGVGAAALTSFGGPFATTTIKMGTTGYFWITADIASGAAIDDNLKVSAISGSDLTTGGTYSGTPTDGGLQTISEQVIRDSAFITFLNGASFDFSNNVSGSYIGEFNIFDADLFKTKSHKWGLIAGIQRLNYGSGNINGNDSINVTYSHQNFLLNPLNLTNDDLSVDSGAQYLRQYNKYTSTNKNTIWGIYVQPTLRISGSNSFPNEGIFLNAHLELVLNQWSQTVIANTLNQSDTQVTKKVTDVNDSNFYWVRHDTTTYNYNIASGYFGVGVTFFSHLGNDTSAHFFAQFTTGAVINSPNFGDLYNVVKNVPTQKGTVPYTTTYKNAKGFYLIKAEFSKTITKSQLVIGGMIRGNFGDFYQSPQYAVYLGVNLNLISIFNAL